MNNINPKNIHKNNNSILSPNITYDRYEFILLVVSHHFLLISSFYTLYVLDYPVNVKGYKTIYNQNGIQLRAYQDKCTAIFNTGSQSFSTSETPWINGFVPTGYRPANPIITHTTANFNGFIFIENTGNLKRKSLTGSFNASVWCEMSWNY